MRDIYDLTSKRELQLSSSGAVFDADTVACLSCVDILEVHITDDGNVTPGIQLHACPHTLRTG